MHVNCLLVLALSFSGELAELLKRMGYANRHFASQSIE